MAAPQEAIIDYLVIGHVSEDRRSGDRVLGGTVAYAGLTARALGLRTGVLTGARPDLGLELLNSLHVERVPSEVNTSYENLNSDSGTRTQILHSRAAALQSAHLPPAWRSVPIVHLGPIADELDGTMLRELEVDLVGATPQGWMRTWDAEGRTSPSPWRFSATLRERVDAVVLSLEDLGSDPSLAESLARHFDPLVVTAAGQGADVYSERRIHHLDAVQVGPYLDATGAGDIFAAAFFVHFADRRDPVQAGGFANYLAGCSVTRLGLESVPLAAEIRRAWQLAGL